MPKGRTATTAHFGTSLAFWCFDVWVFASGGCARQRRGHGKSRHSVHVKSFLSSPKRCDPPPNAPVDLVPRLQFQRPVDHLLCFGQFAAIHQTGGEIADKGVVGRVEGGG